MLLALTLFASIGSGFAPLTEQVWAQRAWDRQVSTAHQAAEEELEGSLEILIEDSSSGSRTLYFLKRASDRISLRFVATPRNLRTGAQVRVRGNFESGGWFRVVSLERVAPPG